MNIARSRTNSDPRVAQLLGQADMARGKKDFQLADKLEGEAEALVAEEQHSEQQLDAVVKLKTRFRPTVVLLTPKQAKAKVKDLKLEQRAADHMTRQKDGESVRMSRVPVQDRTRLLALLGQIPNVAPFAQLFKPQTPSGNSGDATQYGLAATGACLMAVEPAAGGVLLMFSCLINAVHEEAAPETEEERKTVEEEELQETSRAGLFTAKPDKLGWIIA